METDALDPPDAGAGVGDGVGEGDVEGDELPQAEAATSASAATKRRNVGMTCSRLE